MEKINDTIAAAGYLGTLAKAEGLSNLSATTRRRLADQAQLKRLAPGEVLYSPDSREDCVYYLLAGELDLYWRQMSVERVKAGSARASQAFDVQARRRVTVNAVGAAIVARFNRSLLMRELGDESAQHVPGAIEVAELAELPAADWMARLVATKLFAQLPSTHIQRLFSALQPVTGTAGQTLIEQGEAPLWYYIVAEGQCAMSRTIAPGGRTQALENLGPGDCFGELPLITGRRWDVRVQWVSNGIAMRLPEVVFRELLCAPLLQALSPQQALAARATGAVWVDVRSPEVHRQDKLPGSLNVPLSLLRFLGQRLPPEHPLVVCGDEPAANAAGAFLLRAAGRQASYLAAPMSALKGATASRNTQPVASDNVIPLNRTPATASAFAPGAEVPDASETDARLGEQALSLGQQHEAQLSALRVRADAELKQRAAAMRAGFAIAWARKEQALRAEYEQRLAALEQGVLAKAMTSLSGAAPARRDESVA